MAGAEVDAQDTALKAIMAALQLFDLCPPQEGGTIRKTDLEDVLRIHLGQNEAAAGVQRHFNAWESEAASGHLDFLSYWHGMDIFFAEAGAWPAPGRSQTTGGLLDDMRSFRNGLLALRRRCDAQLEIPPSDLEDLVTTVQGSSGMPDFWDQVVSGVRRRGEQGLSFHQLAKAMHDWLGIHSGGGRRRSSELPPPATHKGASRRRSLSASARLGLQSEAAAIHRGSWLDVVTRSARQSDLFLEGAYSPAAEVQRALEFVEFIGGSLDPDTHAHQAQQQLLTTLSNLGRTLMRQETDLSSLRNSNSALGQKRELLEAELANVREFQEDIRELQEQRDAERRQAEALEHEVVNLKDQCLHSGEELTRLRAALEEAERQRIDAERREWQWRDQCNQLEQAADVSEGQTQWMRQELDKQRGDLAHAKDERESLVNEITRLQQALEAATEAARAAPAPEGIPSAEESKKQRRLSTPVPQTGTAKPAGRTSAQPAEGNGMQESLHRTQLELLRSMRDELLKVDSAWAEEQCDEEACESPRHWQLQRHCRFLEMQLQALLRHTQGIEQVLDTQRDSHLGPSPDIQRRLSIQRVQQDGEALFNELSERLHTLEVQKSDADLEVQRLQAIIVELRQELTTAQQSREALLLELRSTRNASVRDELRACQKGEDELFGEDGALTSETQSVCSSGAKTGDSASFLTEARGALTSSPKCLFSTGVQKVIHAQQLTGHGDSEKKLRKQERREEGVRRPDKPARGAKRTERDECETQ